jgi:hypothetical protein
MVVLQGKETLDLEQAQSSPTLTQSGEHGSEGVLFKDHPPCWRFVRDTLEGMHGHPVSREQISQRIHPLRRVDRMIRSRQEGEAGTGTQAQQRAGLAAHQ